MSAIGPGLFDDDDAASWVGPLTGRNDLSLICETLDIVVPAPSEPLLRRLLAKFTIIESDEASEALAAAEVVAALCGSASPELPTEAANWVAEHSHLDAAPLKAWARRVVSRVQARSELNSLWRAQPDYPRWRANVQDLRRRLR